MFNGKVVQTVEMSLDRIEGVYYGFYLDGVKYFEIDIKYTKGKDGQKDKWEPLPIGNNKASCELVKFDPDGNSDWVCYFFTDNTKMSDCTQDDVFMGVPIYKDKQGYYYRFANDGKAVQLACTKDSKGKWIYWDCLKAHYHFKKWIRLDEEEQTN